MHVDHQWVFLHGVPTIGVTAVHNLMTVAVAGWLDSVGVDPASIRYVEMSPPTMEAALQAKRVDAVAAYEPFLSDAVAHGAKPIGNPLRFDRPAIHGHGLVHECAVG
jgi:hypothetical protein